MAKADLGPLSLHYVRAGSGPDVVLVHGLASDLAFWYLGVMRLLSRSFRVTAFDLRGHGYSGTPASGYTSADLAGDLAALMDHLGIVHAHLVGHSFGGSVALHLAVERPQRVVSLTLADARVNDLQPRLPRHDDERWRGVRAALEELGFVLPPTIPAVAFAVLEELLESMGENGTGTLGQAGPMGFFGIRDGGSRKLDRWLRLMETTSARQDFNAVAGLTRERLRELRHPTLAVYGERSCCMESGRELQRHLQHCSTVVLPGAGHLHPFLQPAIFVEHAAPFILAQSHGADSEVGNAAARA